MGRKVSAQEIKVSYQAIEDKPTTLSAFSNDAGFVTINDAFPIGSGKVLQLKSSSIPAMSGTTTIALNNSMPTTAAGVEIWSDTIAPSKVESRIFLQGAFLYTSGTSGRTLVVHVFRDSTCIGTTVGYAASSAVNGETIFINYVDTPATIDSVTYSIRIGSSANTTWYINRSPTQFYNGTMATNPMILQELA